MLARACLTCNNVNYMDYSPLESPLYKILLNGKHMRLPKGQVISVFDDNAMISLIKSGYVKRYLITREGTKGIQVIYGPDDMFPLTPVYKNIFKMDIYTGPEQYYYESITDLDIYSITQTQLQEALNENPLIYKDLFYIAGLRLNSNIYRMENMSLRVANRKIAYQLLYLSKKFGEHNPDNSVMIKVPLTHQTLADILNLARETVTNCMSYLLENGTIKTVGKNIIIADMDKLTRSAAH